MLNWRLRNVRQVVGPSIFSVPTGTPRDPHVDKVDVVRLGISQQIGHLSLLRIVGVEQ